MNCVIAPQLFQQKISSFYMIVALHPSLPFLHGHLNQISKIVWASSGGDGLLKIRATFRAPLTFFFNFLLKINKFLVQ